MFSSEMVKSLKHFFLRLAKTLRSSGSLLKDASSVADCRAPDDGTVSGL
jgi:hypothetical protein